LESIFGRTARWRSLVAGAVAGPSLLITGRKTRHTSMAIYILLRAAVLAARCGIKNERAGSLCRPLSWKHGDTFLMCLSSSQILSAWILKPDSLPSSYISFLNKHGGKDISIVKGFKELALKIEPFTALKAIEEHYKSTGVDLQLDPQMSIPCKVMTTPLLHKQPIILYSNHLHLCTLWLEAVCVEDQFSHFCTFALGCFHILCSI
jgi:hypothetical protein